MANSAADIQKLYIAYFNRPADPAGLAYWMAEKQTMAQIADNFGRSAEYTAQFAGQKTEAVIAALYQNLFGHEADFNGLMYWTNQVNSGKATIGSVAINIVSGATGNDAAIINAKVVAATSFTAAIDTTSEAVAYLSNAGMSAAKTWLSLVNSDATAASQIANQNATLSSIVSTPSTVVGSMTVLQDTIMGTSGNDTILARIVNNTNTFQSGDKIDGGAGIDRLEADVGNSQAFAITGESANVETVAFRAQTLVKDGTANNLGNDLVQIDAQRMVGVNQWESNNSRADLVVEDVRILPTQITKDITIAMVETDPGHVDMGVYFDQYSLRAQTNSSNVLRLQLMDTRSNAAGEAPLKESPYKGFAFYFDGVLITVESPAIDAAKTYAELQTAVAAAVAAVPALAGVTVTLGSSFTVSDTLGSLQTGTEILLTSTSGKTISTAGTGTGWIANGAVPPSSGLHTAMSTVATNTTDLVTSKIILDDVGRGSTGGDLVVGGLSTGATSSSQGVQRFEIEVRDNSKLEHISSTNNTLREVSFVNGVTSSSNSAYTTTVKDKGNLSVLGNIGANGTPGAGDTALPGTVSSVTGNQHGAFGFSDVRLLDGSKFDGKLTYTAEVTSLSIGKYLNLADIAANPGMDNVAFTYTGGNNDDTMAITVNGSVLASNSLIQAGREDVVFSVDGGAGNDNITFKMVDGLVGGTSAWYTNQKLNANATVSGGAGNDTIWTPGAGDVKINGGDGNDTVYADNTGDLKLVARSDAGVTPALTVSASKAVFVFNTADQVGAAGAGEARNLADLISSSNSSYNLYRGKLNVSFKGLEATVDIPVPTSGYKTSDLQINNAIKNAINNDAVLSKLLVAADGPANTLVVTSLIDGVIATTDLVVSLIKPVAGILSVAEVASAAAAYSMPVGTTEAALLAAMNNTLTADYTTAYAETGAFGVDSTGAAAVNTNLAGVASTSTSDNRITGGAGDDVMVLGTTVGATAVDSSNDTIVFAGSFGNDTIVNFNTGVANVGGDLLNFTALGGSGAGFSNVASLVDGALDVVATVAGTNSTAALIKTNVFNVDAVGALNAYTQVYITYDATNNAASVYQIVDGAAAGDLTVTLMGTVDLANVNWATLTAANFS